MARLTFLPIADQIESGTYLLYDGAAGTGGMLKVAEDTLKQLAQEHGKQVSTDLRTGNQRRDLRHRQSRPASPRRRRGGG
jgi:type I restriction-modification system DNA methylase subunit